MQVGRVKAAPYQRAVLFRGKQGGWVWNKPSHVIVDQDGIAARVPIPDQTRRLQIFFWSLGIVFFLAGLLFSKKRKEQQI